MRVVPLLFSIVSGRKNVLIHYIIKSESPVIQKNYRTFAFVRVELVGFEPTSKQGNHMLSTCLFQPSVFVPRQDLDHQSRPYPLKFHPDGEAHHRLFPIYLHRLTLRFGTTSLERCLVPPTLWRNKANLLYFD